MIVIKFLSTMCCLISWDNFLMILQYAHANMVVATTVQSGGKQNSQKQRKMLRPSSVHFKIFFFCFYISKIMLRASSALAPMLHTYFDFSKFE